MVTELDPCRSRPLRAAPVCCGSPTALRLNLRSFTLRASQMLRVPKPGDRK
jgi:hypothetical protein